MVRALNGNDHNSYNGHAHAQMQAARLGDALRKLRLPWNAVHSFSASHSFSAQETQRYFPHIVFLKSPAESILYMNKGVDEVKPENVHKAYSVLLRSRETLDEVLPIIWPYLPQSSSRKNPMGFVFDARSGFFAVKQEPKMSHLATAYSFAVFRPIDMAKDYPDFLKGWFNVSQDGRITKVTVTPITKESKQIEALKADPFILEGIYFQLARNLREALDLPDMLPIMDDPSLGFHFLRDRRIQTLGDCFTKLKP